MNTQKTTLTAMLMIILTMFSITAFAEEGNNQQEKDRMRLICQNDCEQATFNQVNPSQNDYKLCISACDEQYAKKK